MKKILIMGLPRAGKTNLAKALAPLLGAVHFEADVIRKNINKDLGFSHEDRLEQARRMGHLCDIVVNSGNNAIADFICPTDETRAAFGNPAFIIFVNTLKPHQYADTAAMFVAPENVDYVVTDWDLETHLKKIVSLVSGFDWKKPTALLLGRYQPFHDGHKALTLEALSRVGQVCIAVRDTQGTDEKNPFDFSFVKQRIEESLSPHTDKFVVIQLPNITNIYYGRDVGYSIEKLELSQELQDISATKVRKTILG